MFLGFLLYFLFLFFFLCLENSFDIVVVCLMISYVGLGITCVKVDS